MYLIELDASKEHKFSLEMCPIDFNLPQLHVQPL
jgi:hypothetical protein